MRRAVDSTRRWAPDHLRDAPEAPLLGLSLFFRGVYRSVTAYASTDRPGHLRIWCALRSARAAAPRIAGGVGRGATDGRLAGGTGVLADPAACRCHGGHAPARGVLVMARWHPGT